MKIVLKTICLNPDTYNQEKLLLFINFADFKWNNRIAYSLCKQIGGEGTPKADTEEPK